MHQLVDRFPGRHSAALHEKAAPILERRTTREQDKNPAAVFNEVEAAEAMKNTAAETLMKQNEKIDERFERRAFNLSLLVGRNLFQIRSSIY